MIETNVDVGANFKKIRKSKGFTQQMVADAIGVGRTNLSKIENNKQNLTPEQIIRFCIFCDTSADFLLNLSTGNKVVYDKNTNDELQLILQEAMKIIKK